MDKKKTLQSTIDSINNQYGKGTVLKLGEAGLSDYEGISTGSLSLDIALGGKGLPRGRMCELYGVEGGGKSTLALTVIANAQKAGGKAAFIDVEYALDPTWCKKIGVNTDTLLISQPNSAEEALDVALSLIESNAIDVLVIDSVAALIPSAELQGEMGASHMGLAARLMNQACRKLTSAISTSKTCVIFINQIRHKIGVMFGSNETTPGGRGIKFFSSVRLDVRRIATLKNSAGEAIGIRIRARVVKNKCAAPFKQAEFELMFDRGISMESDLIDLAVARDIVIKSGAWFHYGQIRLGQGRLNATDFLRNNPEVATEIKDEILENKNES